jgi:hypothetical protein
MAAIVMIALGGCASNRPASIDPLGAVPSDFTIDVAVISGGRGEEDRETGEVVPAELRSGRFLVFPSGELHYAARDVTARDTRPPLTRRLSRDELSHLWSLCQQSGLVDAQPLTMSESRKMNPARGAVIYIVTIQVDGEYRGVARTFERSEAANSAEGTLVRELAALAWADEMPAERAVVIPKRYDFGADPYERYRE